MKTSIKDIKEHMIIVNSIPLIVPLHNVEKQNVIEMWLKYPFVDLEISIKQKPINYVV